MNNLNLVPEYIEEIKMYSFKTPLKNIEKVDILKKFHQIINQRSIEFLFEAKKVNAPASSFTIPMQIKNKRQKIAYKVFKLKDDEFCFEFSPQKLEFNTWMEARDCTYDNIEKGGGKCWLGDHKKDNQLLLHTFHCFRRYEDAVIYKKLVEFQKSDVKSNLIIMPVKIDVSVFSLYEIVYLPYLDYVIFGVNTTLMYVDYNNIII